MSRGHASCDPHPFLLPVQVAGLRQTLFSRRRPGWRGSSSKAILTLVASRCTKRWSRSEKVVEKYCERVICLIGRREYGTSAPLHTKTLTWTGRDRTVVMEKRDEENDEKQEGVAIPIDFTQECGETKEDIDSLPKKGLPWKWADAAGEHQLRIIDWPAELKRLPQPRFRSLPSTTAAATERKRQRDEGEGEGEGKSQEIRASDSRIVDKRYAPAPMNSNFNGLRLDDSSEVDIVKCADGTSPLKANASNALIRAPGNRGKPKPSKNRKRKTADTAVDDDIDERDAKSRKDDAAGKRKATNKVDERRAPPPPVASPRPSLSPPPFPQHLKFGRRCRRIWFRSWARNRYRRWSTCE